MRKSVKLSLAASIAAVLSLASAYSASAHISIRPVVDASGSSVSALTAGQSGTLNFRVGHGCTEAEANIVDPNTDKSLQGTKWGTHVFSVTIPVLAQGTGTTVPKAQYVPGWKISLTKDAASGAYTVTWTAVSSEFDIPDGPTTSDATIAANLYADFGVAIKWSAAAAGQTVFFPSKQTCVVTIPGLVRSKTVKTRVGGKSVAKKVTVTNPSSQHLIYNDWSVTDGSGADTVADDTEHNTAPSVLVLKP
ncbi:MAG: hypothetical protein RLZZ603_580 [Actinomycetota bacterium]|jgi:uncharacterized protein YcnI